MASGETILNGRYRLVAQLGSGGMAVIYKAVDQFLGRTVAIKILRPSLTDDPTFITRFRNEARSIANLAHPNIVTVHDVGNDGQTHYMVMEYVEGRDLKRIIRTEGKLSIEHAVNLGIQICAGIGFAHRAGIVHADVKPQNILVTEDFRVKVTDFGIAQALTDTQPTQRQEVVWGSPHYFAPEQAQGEKPSAASDVYAIGIVIFEMVTGQLPYTGNSQKELALAHLREPVPVVRDINPAVPENLSRIIFKVMQKEPSARYRMADQLGHILESYRDQGQAHTTTHPKVFPEQVDQPPTLPPPPRVSPRSGNVVPQRLPHVPPIMPQPDNQSAGLGQRGTGAYGTPTQRFGPAPVAPQPLDYGQKIPAPRASDSKISAPWDPQSGQSSQVYTPANYPESQPSGRLDIVTIALAMLALVAVFGLIPLYIIVFRAWNGA